MKYPDGSIKSYEELCKIEDKRPLFNKNENEVYGASKEFGCVMRLGSFLGLKLSTMRDHNIPKNGYNDWFLFADEEAAKLYAGVK